MLVTFSTDNYANITLFGDVAMELLALMGHSQTVPGAIPAKDVAGYLTSLLRSVEGHRKGPNLMNTGTASTNAHPADDEDAAPAVAIWYRALPLIALMEVAQVRNNNIKWH